MLQDGGCIVLFAARRYHLLVGVGSLQGEEASQLITCPMRRAQGRRKAACSSDGRLGCSSLSLSALDRGDTALEARRLGSSDVESQEAVGGSTDSLRILYAGEAKAQHSMTTQAKSGCG